MTALRPALVLITCLQLSASVVAEGRLDTPLVVVQLNNEHHEDCVEYVSNLCPATVRGEGVGDLEINATQRIEYVGVATNLSLIWDRLGYALLPDGSVRQNASDAYVENGVLPAITVLVGHVDGPDPIEEFYLHFDESGIRYGFLGPDVKPISAEPGQRRGGFHYSEDGGLEYRRVGPFNQVGAMTSSDVWTSSLSTPCERQLNDGHCSETVTKVTSTAQAETPNVATGWEFYEAQFAGRPEALDPRPPVTRDHGPGAVGSRMGPSLGPDPLLDPPPAGRMPSLLGWPSQPPPEGTVLARPVREDAAPEAPESPDPADTPREGPAPFVAASIAFGLAVLLASLYSRITDAGRAIKSVHRAAILDTLRHRGPSSIADLAEALNLDPTTVQHHVRVLNRLSQVVVRHAFRTVHVRLPGQIFMEPRLPAAERIIQVLKAAGGRLARTELHSVLDEIPSRTRNHALRTLLVRGLIEESTDGGGSIQLRSPASSV